MVGWLCSVVWVVRFCGLVVVFLVFGSCGFILILFICCNLLRDVGFGVWVGVVLIWFCLYCYLLCWLGWLICWFWLWVC